MRYAALFILLVASACNNDKDVHPCDSCLECEECVDDGNGPQCQAEAGFGKICGDDGSVLVVDSCDSTESTIECPAGQGVCATPEPYNAFCDCLNYWEGEDCSTCPENWSPLKECDGCVPHWEGEECDVCSGNWDIATNCDECLGNWDEESDCTECSNNWVDEGNDCGTCPDNWDAQQDCAACENHWTGDDCEVCPGNWDPAADCNDCLGNWDPTADCQECATNWSIDSDCTSCLPGWYGVDCEVGRVFVDGTTSGAGLTWSEAFATIEEGQDACDDLNVASAAPDNCEVWVAEGTYHVYETSNDDSIHMREDVHLYGGFDGSETALSQRDWNANPTILDGQWSGGGLYQVFHVVEGSDNSVLDGFSITGGDASASSGDANKLGAGLYNDGVSPTVRNCEFSYNYSSDEGGAVYNKDNAAIFENCTFFENQADIYGGAVMNLSSYASFTDCVFTNNTVSHSYGRSGAMHNDESDVTIERCEFTDNFSSTYGGAISNIVSHAIITDSYFGSNHTGNGGGAIYNYSCHSQIQNCLFRGNWVASSGSGSKWGGAMYNLDGLPRITNCSFYMNSATEGGTMVNNNSPARVTNCILFYNSPYEIGETSCNTDVQFSNVQDGFPGYGNIDAVPVFSDPSSGDFSLHPTSPCIDAANGDVAMALDIEGNPRVDDPSTANTGEGTPNYVDMGAYEYQP